MKLLPCHEAAAKPLENGMNTTDLIAKTLDLNSDFVANMALKDMTDEDLLRQPGPGWLPF